MDFTQAEQDIRMIKEIKLFNAGYVQKYDFSKANSSEAHRIHAVTMIANVCRGDKGVRNREKLYQQLLTEHDGKPGEVFQFVPMKLEKAMLKPYWRRIFLKHGVEKNKYIHMNLRSWIHKDGNQTEIYNLENMNGFHVFKIKIPMMIVQHILRHGQLSFMQVSERTQKLREYYYCDEFESVLDLQHEGDEIMDRDKTTWNELCYEASQCDWDLWQERFKIRQELCNKGSHGLVYVTMWIAGYEQDLSQWDNFFAVRTKNPSQAEMQTLAKTMKEMIDE